METCSHMKFNTKLLDPKTLVQYKPGCNTPVNTHTVFAYVALVQSHTASVTCILPQTHAIHLSATLQVASSHICNEY